MTTYNRISEEQLTWGPLDPRWQEFYADRIYYDGQVPTRTSVTPLSEDFGRNLNTMEKARLWLTNPHNWHSSKLFVLKWDGLLCTISENRAIQLIREPWDQGLPWCVVAGQRTRRNRKERGESMEEAESALGLEE